MLRSTLATAHRTIGQRATSSTTPRQLNPIPAGWNQRRVHHLPHSEVAGEALDRLIAALVEDPAVVRVEDPGERDELLRDHLDRLVRGDAQGDQRDATTRPRRD